MGAHEGYISWSELSTFRSCPHKWYLSYVERLSLPRLHGATTLGTEWHSLLERFFRDKEEAKETIWRELATTLESSRSAQEVERVRTLQWMWQGWVDHGYRAFEGWSVESIEASEMVPLDDRISVKVKKDLVMRDPLDRLWVVDHKSTGRYSKPDETDLSFDDQAGLYLLGEHLKGNSPYGAVWSYAITKDTKSGRSLEERYWQVYHRRTVHELETVRKEALEDVRRMLEIRSLSEATRHPDKDHCRWMCDFRSACLLARRGELKDEVQAILDMGGSKYTGREAAVIEVEPGDDA